MTAELSPTEPVTAADRLFLCHLDDLRPGRPYRVVVDEHDLVLVRIEGRVYALEDRCSHQNVRLSEGDVWAADREIECHRHGSTFSLETGAAQSLPATAPVPTYSTQVDDGEVYLTSVGS